MDGIGGAYWKGMRYGGYGVRGIGDISGMRTLTISAILIAESKRVGKYFFSMKELTEGLTREPFDK
jgi:hypothetical protein